jgi:ribose transport system ATP-binding protein
MMVGQQTNLERIQRRERTRSAPDRTPVLDVQGITHHHHKFREITFSVFPGEILGIIGLTGAGKTELARTLFGLERLEGGRIRLGGKAVTLRRPQQAIGQGIVYVTESRKSDGLFLDMTIRDNIAAPVLEEVSGGLGFLSTKRMEKRVMETIEKFDISTTGGRQVVNTLSGGNQQKVLLGIWLQLRPRVLMVDEPTVGIDVTSKGEIFQLLRRIADSGTAVILISSETKEVINHSDRILTLYNGRKTGDFPADQVDENVLLEYISGLREADR